MGAVSDAGNVCAGEDLGVSPLPRTEDEAHMAANNVPAAANTLPAADDVPLATLYTLSKAEVETSAAENKSVASDVPFVPQKPPLVFPSEGRASHLAKTHPRKKHRRRVRAPRIQTLKGLFSVVMLTWVLLLLVFWLVSLGDEGVIGKEEGWIHAGVHSIVFLAAGLAVARKAFMDRWPHVRQKKVRSTLPLKVIEEEKDDWQFLRRRISFLTQEEMNDLESGSLLGCGGHGLVRQVLYEGTEAVIKEFRDPDALLPLMREARFMVELGGAGGVPEILAVCFNPAAIVQEFVGKTYDKFLRRCSVDGFLESLVTICRRLGEVHDKGVVHNDLKIDNITFSGSVHEPAYHIIDLGWACRVGRVAGDFTLDDDDNVCGDGKYEKGEVIIGCPWMAPEVRARQLVYPSGDVYSFGFLLQYFMQSCKQGFLTEPLGRQAELCLVMDPRCRPSLTEVAEAITGLQDELLPHQLDEDFHFVEYE